ncbi:MAG: hypothetical protein OXF05_00300 [Hyphomicrobiales bacterium]|nr:hypothetical protein [Hyphomicrobiales bacterium]MCY4038354.1 hypothetical protein [Hyphomicrobiales bacterium]
MKTTLITTFVFALVVFAFNANPVVAGDSSKPWSLNLPHVNELKDRDQDEDDTNQYAQSEPGFQWSWEQDSNTGNWGWVKKYLNEGGKSGEQVAFDTEHCWLTISGEVDCDYSDYWWNQQNGEREIALPHPPIGVCDPHTAGTYCPSKDQDENNLAGLTRREKQQQDEDDWNAWIRAQFAGLRPGQRRHLHDKEKWQSWVQKQFAGYVDHCSQTGNCMMLEDAESRDGFGGRDVADSGDQGSTSAAGADGQ